MKTSGSFCIFWKDLNTVKIPFLLQDYDRPVLSNTVSPASPQRLPSVSLAFLSALLIYDLFKASFLMLKDVIN